MKYISYIFAIILILSGSCASLDIGEIRNYNKVEFESLRLVPGREINDLRIDLIRQTHVEHINDSTEKTEDTPYLPLGFDLGNGLFYDLDGNLSIRIDYLLGLLPDNNFEIYEINRPEKNKGIITYSFKNDSLTISSPLRKRSLYRYHLIRSVDSLSVMYRKQLRYSIIETDTSAILSGKRWKWATINKLDENQYYLNKRKKRVDYKLIGSEIFLDNNYIVSLTNNNLTLKIKKQGIIKDRVLYTIENINDKIFIYNNKYHGLKIERDSSNIRIYRNKKLLVIYKMK
jgi:hypothetical protein